MQKKNFLFIYSKKLLIFQTKHLFCYFNLPLSTLTKIDIKKTLIFGIEKELIKKIFYLKNLSNLCYHLL